MWGKYFVILLLILMACEPAIQTVPTSEYQPPIMDTADIKQDLCKDVTCANGQECKEGRCVCPSDEKECGNECIQKEQCCDDKDCETGNCIEGECVAPKECSYNQEFADGECKCAKNTYYCEEQKKCIERGKCCRHTECNSFERCVLTNLKTSLCIKIEEKKVCKTLADHGRSELYLVKNSTFKVQATEWHNDESITFQINNQTIKIKPNQEITFENATIFQEGITTIGGYCVEDEE